jgi:hypothetical protein
VDAHTLTKQAKKLLNKRLLARKLIETVFWEGKGVLIVEFKQGTTMTSEMYCETLRKLRRAIQNKRHGMLTYGVFIVLLHDNARPYTAAPTRALLEHFNWVLFNHTFYSPDLAPSY